MSYVYGMEVVREKRKAKYEKNKVELNKKAKEYRDNLPRDGEVYLKRKKYMKEFNKKRNARPEVRNADLIRKYGITLIIYEAMLKIQKNKCANTLCANTLQQKPHDTHTDHDHDTGSVRGILCNGCNTLLGKLEKLLKFLIEDKIELPSDFKDEQQRGLYLYLKEDYDEWNNSWGANDYRNLLG
jgi:hypothetical protein